MLSICYSCHWLWFELHFRGCIRYVIINANCLCHFMEMQIRYLVEYKSKVVETLLSFKILLPPLWISTTGFSSWKTSKTTKEESIFVVVWEQMISVTIVDQKETFYFFFIYILINCFSTKYATILSSRNWGHTVQCTI